MCRRRASAHSGCRARTSDCRQSGPPPPDRTRRRWKAGRHRDAKHCSTTAAARHAPRSLWRRTTSPSPMPRAAASSGWMRTGSRSLIFEFWLFAPKSNWLCRRVAGWLAMRCNGKPASDPTPSAGGSQTGCPGQSSYPNPAIVADAISILPLGVDNGAVLGSRRNLPTIPPSEGRVGNASSPNSQNASKSGASAPRSSSARRVGS